MERIDLELVPQQVQLAGFDVGEIDTRLDRSEQWIGTANTSFIAERSPVKRGMTLVRRRSPSKLWSGRRLGGAGGRLIEQPAA